MKPSSTCRGGFWQGAAAVAEGEAETLSGAGPWKCKLASRL